MLGVQGQRLTLSTDPADAEAFAAYLAAHLPATHLQRPGDILPPNATAVGVPARVARERPDGWHLS